jgi:hypothetical protein
MEQIFNKPSMLPPQTGNSSSRPPTTRWEVQRPVIERLYTTEGKKLKEVIQIMENEYGFHATYL